MKNQILTVKDDDGFNQVLTVKDDDGYDWFIRKIDGTHVFLSIDINDKDHAWHIGQLAKNSYYQNIIDFINK